MLLGHLRGDPTEERSRRTRVCSRDLPSRDLRPGVGERKEKHPCVGSAVRSAVRRRRHEAMTRRGTTGQGRFPKTAVS